MRAFEQNVHEARLAHERAVERRGYKAEITGKGVAALITINGGGAVALGGFLQAIIDKPAARPLVPLLLDGIAFTVAGVLLAAAIFVAQYFQFWIEESNRFRARNPAWWAVWLLVGLSLLCFARGMMLVALDAKLLLRSPLL